MAEQLTSSILVTGANGYIGRALGEELSERGYSVYGAVRGMMEEGIAGYQQLFSTGNLGKTVDWGDALEGVECVIHLAARAHRLNETQKEATDIYHEVNCNGTLNLAKQAAKVGVKRFIYISSIGVLGDRSEGLPFTNHSAYAPDTPYTYSKMEAEIGLDEIAENSEMDIVVIRPPLVYGEGVPGNFLRLLKLVRLGIPLPFGALHSTRSMIYLGNLLDFMIKCIDSPAAVNRKWVISDGTNWSTAELVRQIASSMGKRLFLIPIPLFLLRFVGTLVGEVIAVDKLSSPLRVDNSDTMKLLGWEPPYAPEYGLKRSVEHYILEKRCS